MLTLCRKNFVFFFISLLNSSTGIAFKQEKMPQIRSFCTYLIEIFHMYFIFISDDRWVSGAGPHPPHPDNGCRRKGAGNTGTGLQITGAGSNQPTPDYCNRPPQNWASKSIYKFRVLFRNPDFIFRFIELPPETTLDHCVGSKHQVNASVDRVFDSL
jgi:hypothetical protein